MSVILEKGVPPFLTHRHEPPCTACQRPPEGNLPNLRKPLCFFPAELISQPPKLRPAEPFRDPL